MIEDGHSHVVAYAFVSSEQQHTVTNLLKTFVTNNPKASETSVVIVDKDFTEISAIKEAFQSQPAIQLCQFHVMKALMAAAEQVSSSSEERDHLYKSFKETVHAPTPDAFEEAKKDFFLGLPTTMLKGTLKKIGHAFHTCGHDISVTEFTAGNNRTSRVESQNGKIKQILQSSVKLHEALRGTLKLSSAQTRESRHHASTLKTSTFYTSPAPSKLQALCAKDPTTHACTAIKDLTPYSCTAINKEVDMAKKTDG